MSRHLRARRLELPEASAVAPCVPKKQDSSLRIKNNDSRRRRCGNSCMLHQRWQYTVACRRQSPSGDQSVGTTSIALSDPFVADKSAYLCQ
jgi:hypothetical protein